MKRAYSVKNVMSASFRTVGTEGRWRECIGNPEFGGSWLVYGPPKNGKTSFAMMLARYLAETRRVAYDSVEEGKSRTIQLALERTGMMDCGGRFVLLDKESVDDLKERLDKHKSPDVVVIDSVQFMEMKFSEYKELKARYPHKLFVYVSHVQGNLPEGHVARRIWRDANVAWRVEGFRAFPVSRYGGGTTIDIDRVKATEYHGIGM